MKVVIVTAPSFDPYTENVSGASTSMLKNCGIEMKATVLKEEKATKERLLEAINEAKPDLIIINGHGDANSVRGHNNETLISTGDGELYMYADTVIYAISCDTAQDLAETLIANNTKAYIGYTDQFEIYVDSSDDTIVKFFVDPANEVSLQLLHNKTVNESVAASRELFEKNLRLLYASTNPIVASSRNLMLASLLKDYKALVAKGDLSAKI